MIIARIPRLLSKTFRSLTWELPADEKHVYLTFDDGPTPEVTDWVLGQLDAFDARATFFCLGKNVEANPELYNRILHKGHAVGNHSFSHIKGFGTSLKHYITDVRQASELIKSDLFRPPYGRIRPAQVRALKEEYKIIMWSVLSVDYNHSLKEEQVIRNVLDNVRPGSIIVFHDSVKASKNLYAALPKVLSYLKDQGYTLELIR